MNEKDVLILNERHKEIRINAAAQCKASVKKEHLNFKLGITVVILTTIAGMSIFTSTVGTGQNDIIRIITGVISFLAALLASLQTFLRYSERSNQHHDAAVKYDYLRKRVEHLLNYPPDNKNDIENRLKEIDRDFNLLRRESPNTPDQIWQNVKKEYSNDEYIDKLVNLINKKSDRRLEQGKI
ncbi:MAG: SLATT domain-containing protein [Desulfobacteraceae bacterium]|jgi:hypothetical protein